MRRFGYVGIFEGMWSLNSVMFHLRLQYVRVHM